MVSQALTSVIRRRCRTFVATAMVPLVFLNAWPVSAGCICADGHRERVCCAAKRGAGPACCINRSAAGEKKCCSRPAEQPPDCSAGCRLSDGGRCTPIVQQAIPAVVKSSPVVDDLQLNAPVLSIAVISLTAADTVTVACINRDTGRPISDRVIAFHRLVI
jgi:hypothetical protein